MMTRLISIHPDNPQQRLLEQVGRAVMQSQVIVLPTDSGYSLCCQLGEKTPQERICRIRQFDDRHFFTLLCRDLSEVSRYAYLDNVTFRFLKSHSPAPITFILSATKQVPKQLLQAKRRTIGVRIPQNLIMRELLAWLDMPLMSVSVDDFPDTWPMLDPHVMREHYQDKVDQIIDAGSIPVEPTTVVDLTSGSPELLRQGHYRID